MVEPAYAVYTRTTGLGNDYTAKILGQFTRGYTWNGLNHVNRRFEQCPNVA